MNENRPINTLPTATDLTGAKITGVKADGTTANFPIDAIVRSQRGFATPAGTPTGSRFAGEKWDILVSDYGSTFTNWGNINVPLKVGAQYVSNAYFEWNGTAWVLQRILVDAPSLTDYATLVQLATKADASAIPTQNDIITGLTPVTGNYMSKVGTVTANASAQYVAVDTVANPKLVVTSTVGGSDLGLATYKDAAGVFISTQLIGTNGVDIAYVDFELTIPVNCKTAYINGKTTVPIVVKKKVYAALATAAALATTNSNVAAINALLSDFVPQTTTVITGFYVNNSGGQVAGAFYKNTSIAVTPGAGDRIKVTSTINGSALALAIYKDAGGAYISRQNQGINGVDSVFTDFELTIPSNAATILINSLAATTLIVKKYLTTAPATPSSVTAVDAKVTALQTKTNSYWFGKTIWYCGTSIPETGYPQIMGTNLGATIINVAKGSSISRRGSKLITGPDPYGWTGVPWQNIAFSLSQTLVEKQDLIDNWVSKWAPLLGGSFDGDPSAAKPATLDTATQNLFKSCSWEMKLKPYLDGTFPMPDLFVFDHGRNDNFKDPTYGDTDSEFTSVPTSVLDRNTFIGSINYLIDKIMAANPRARIAFVSHYENSTTNFARLATAHANLAEYQDFPLFKLYEKLGWTTNLVTTTGYWSNSTTWVPSGGSSQVISLLNVWLQDGIHPFSLPSKTLIANNLSVFIDKLR